MILWGFIHGPGLGANWGKLAAKFCRGAEHNVPEYDVIM